jgi:hypothetical protein
MVEGGDCAVLVERNGFLVTGEPAEISKLQCIVAQLNDYPWTTLTTLAA